jgi:hypothetical protein
MLAHRPHGRILGKGWSILGAALVFFAVTAYGGEFGPTLTDPLFQL